MKYGKNNCFLITPKDVKEFHIPSDLLGLATANYYAEEAKDNPQSALLAASIEIEKAIEKSIWNNLPLKIASKVDNIDPIKVNFKNKIFLVFSNSGNTSIRIDLDQVTLKQFSIDSYDTFYGKDKTYYPMFIIEKQPQGEFHYSTHTLKPKESKGIWIPIDPSIPRDNLQTILDQSELGYLNISIEILDGSEQRYKKRIEF